MTNKRLLILLIGLLSAFVIHAQEVENPSISNSNDKPKEKISPVQNLGKQYNDTKIRKKQVGEAEVYRPPQRISRKYSEGQFLIYDCKARHFACVDSLSYEKCREERKIGLASKAEKILACAPLKKFSNFHSCAKEQYALQHRRVNKTVCLVELGAAAN